MRTASQPQTNCGQRRVWESDSRTAYACRIFAKRSQLHFHSEDPVALRKRKTRTRAKADAAHSDTSSDHHATWFSIGRIIRIQKTKGRRGRKPTKASAKDVKALLRWVVTQL